MWLGGGQGWALGWAVVGDEARKEGQTGCRLVRYWRRRREESCFCSFPAHAISGSFAYH